MKHIFSVSQLNSYIHRIFESDYALRKIYIKGEISNCKYHSSGHIYFTLKDEKSILSCLIFSRDRMKGLDFPLENGQMVIVGGNITVFERDGKYQLYAREITLAGAGLVYQKLEKLKQELNELGYFDFDRKKPIPSYPTKIGVVTALTGAAIEDMKSVAARRNPYVQLFLYNAKVQGEGAAKSIAAGIQYFERFGVDVIIIGRGGGSAEDLWAFNERCVADAIFDAKTPIISGTGHQVDMTIADYCADLRVETPTAACERAIPDVYEILQLLDRYKDSLDYAMRYRFDNLHYQMDVFRRLLDANHPGTQVAQQKQTLIHLQDRIHHLMQEKIKSTKNSLDFYAQKLTSLSPSMRLRGGYVFAQKQDDTPISSVSQIEKGEEFSLIFKDGSALVRTVDLIKEKE
ncbi:MAG: exodeoxyribonuclease VII large subunit [Eubacteriales bacterium]|nr:exodeoxyribonuclease VII large subunit [Eubacteriales bacterium]